MEVVNLFLPYFARLLGPTTCAKNTNKESKEASRQILIGKTH